MMIVKRELSVQPHTTLKSSKDFGKKKGRNKAFHGPFISASYKESVRRRHFRRKVLTKVVSFIAL